MSSKGLICGWGINDAEYVTQPSVEGKVVMCPYYRKWSNMVSRCFTKPAYRHCRITPRWKSFMAFRSWMKTQDWEEKELDKDIIGGGKFYSPETCCFVPLEINRLHTNVKSGSTLPPGVSYRRQTEKYQAFISCRGKSIYLGSFLTPEKAARVYEIKRREYLVSWAEECPDKKVALAILSKLEIL